MATLLFSSRGESCILDAPIDITERKQTEEQLMQAIQAVMKDATWFSRSVMEQLANTRSTGADITSLTELTERERQVLTLMAKGWDNSAIAAELESPNRPYATT